jgi:HEAT repeat protein
MTDPRLVDLACDAPELSQAARRAFVVQGEAAIPTLLAGLEDQGLGGVGHWRVLRLLGELRIESALPAVRTALHRAAARNDPVVLPAAMEALAAFATPEAVGELVALLGFHDPHVVKRAAILLGETESPEALAPLAGLLTHGDPGVRYCAAGALLRLRDPRARAALAAHLERETDRDVRELIRIGRAGGAEE